MQFGNSNQVQLIRLISWNLFCSKKRQRNFQKYTKPEFTYHPYFKVKLKQQNYLFFYFPHLLLLFWFKEIQMSSPSIFTDHSAPPPQLCNFFSFFSNEFEFLDLLFVLVDKNTNFIYYC